MRRKEIVIGARLTPAFWTLYRAEQQKALQFGREKAARDKAARLAIASEKRLATLFYSPDTRARPAAAGGNVACSVGKSSKGARFGRIKLNAYDLGFYGIK